MATLEGKIVLVIGGTSGIGFGVAVASLKSFAKIVIVASSNKDRVENAIKRLTEGKLGSGEIRGHVVDVSNEQSIKSLLEEVGEIDHIVITSNRLDPAIQFPNVDIQAAKQSMDLRVWALVAVAKYAKFNPGGSLTATSGTLAIKPMPKYSVSSADGGALHTLTQGLAVDLAPIRVNTICAGSVDTELWDMLPTAAKQGLQDYVTSKSLVRHIGKPDELAEAYLFCMKCTYITGQYIVVDGGYVLG